MLENERSRLGRLLGGKRNTSAQLGAGAVKAVVELNAGMSATAEEIISLCKERLGSVKAPKSVDFVPALPRSPVGKVLKKDLRATYWQNADRRI